VAEEAVRRTREERGGRGGRAVEEDAAEEEKEEEGEGGEEEETRMTFCECHVDRRWIIRFPPSPSRIDPDALPINPIKPTCQCPLLPGRRARQVMSTSAARPLVDGGLRLKVAASPQSTGRGWPQAKTKMCTPGGVVANLQRITSFS
jgi:hypothetical protein